jgi:hypothetical protein
MIIRFLLRLLLRASSVAAGATRLDCPRYPVSMQQILSPELPRNPFLGAWRTYLTYADGISRIS